MAEETEKKAAMETIAPKGEHVVIDGEDYYVSTFKFAKMVRALTYLTELAEAVNLAEATKGAIAEDATGAVNLSLTGIISAIVNALPKLLKDGVPSLYRLLGLIVTSNQELKALEKGDEDTDAVLHEKGLDLAYAGDPEELLNLLSVAVKYLGTDTIVKNLMPLMGLLKR